MRTTTRVWVALLLCAPPVHAQLPVSVTPSLSLRSAYEGRGLTFTNGPVAQAGLEVGGGRGGWSLLAGAWANVEPRAQRAGAGPRMLPAEIGGPSEINLYGSAARDVGVLNIEAGTIHFLFPHGFDFSRTDLIVELYGRVAVAAPGSPSVAAYYDVSARGWYGEVNAGRSVDTGAGTARVWAQAGASAGQADAGEYYARDGVTHVGTGASYTWMTGGLRVGPDIRWTWAVDGAARAGAVRTGGRLKTALGVTASWNM